MLCQALSELGMLKRRGKVPPKKGQGRGMMIFWCSSN
jgi:hypothetical protein